MEKIEIVRCKCKGHILTVERDEEYNDNCISFWTLGHDGNYDWIFRLRLIWQVITRGHPYTDTIILNRRETQKLIKILSKNIYKKSKNKP